MRRKISLRFFTQEDDPSTFTFGINSLDLVGGLAGPTGSESVQGSDSVGVPLALEQTRHLDLQLGNHVSAGFPFISSSLAAVHVVASDAATTVILRGLPGQEDATG